MINEAQVAWYLVFRKYIMIHHPMMHPYLYWYSCNVCKENRNDLT